MLDGVMLAMDNSSNTFVMTLTNKYEPRQYGCINQL